MKKVECQIPTERIIGVTIPEDGKFYVCDYDEVFEAVIGEQVSFKVTDFEPNEFAYESSTFIGLNLAGKVANTPILSIDDNKITPSFKTGDDYAEIDYDIKKEQGTLKFQTFSSDWFCVSFSKCGQFIILAEPYAIDVYAIEG